MDIEIKKVYNNAQLPLRGSEEAAGVDLYAYIPDGFEYIHPHCTAKIGTGISVSLPKNTFGAIFARSGLATKQGLRPSNCTGVVDSDYRGEIIVALHNDSEQSRVIQNGDRIAQLVVIPYITPEFKEVEVLDITERGNNGFGSSGDK